MWINPFWEDKIPDIIEHMGVQQLEPDEQHAHAERTARMQSAGDASSLQGTIRIPGRARADMRDF